MWAPTPPIHAGHDRLTAFTSDEIAAIRAEFPHLATCCYLDTGATGLAAPGIGAAAAAVYDRMIARGYDGREDWRAIRQRVAGSLGDLLNVDPEAVSFAASSSDALNRVMQAAPIRPGERVIMAADEFPTLAEVFGRLVARGAEVVRVHIGDERERTDALCAAAEGARYVGVSHVHWSTGTRVDLDRLAGACRKGGARLVVDGVHAVGAVPVDASLADVYVTSFFKWTLAGFGLGAAIVEEGLRGELEPQQLGYANLPPSRGLEHSHLNYPGLAALERALTYLSGLGWPRVHARVAELQADLASRLRADGFRVQTPEAAAAGLTCVEVPDPQATARRLDAAGIRVSPRGSALRVSPHFYNLPSESLAFCEALARIEER